MVMQKSPGVMQYSNEIDFAITTYCQAKCRSCARTNEDTGEKEDWLALKHMNLNVFKNTLKNSPNLKYFQIEFCGEFGDPMMHPKIDEFIETALEFAPLVTISTNGALRNPDWYAKIVKKYKKKVHIRWAIDGADHNTNWKYREGVNWQRAIDNMTAYIKSGGIGQWNFLIFKWNWHQIPLARKLADDINISLYFKFNIRSFGLISDEDKQKALKLLENDEIFQEQEVGHE